jgi:hypothetical protein
MVGRYLYFLLYFAFLVGCYARWTITLARSPPPPPAGVWVGSMVLFMRVVCLPSPRLELCSYTQSWVRGGHPPLGNMTLCTPQATVPAECRHLDSSGNSSSRVPASGLIRQQFKESTGIWIRQATVLAECRHLD